jgi:hypothetical protein
VCPLPEPTVPNFEALAAECIRRRLEAHGPAPWSICEARLGEDDYQRLLRWVATVTRLRLEDASGSAGLVLLTFVAEWNRRNSPGDSVFINLPPLFAVDDARRRLYTGNSQPTQFFRSLLRRTCERFHLRHAFAAEQEEDVPYYLSVQLQYGFSLPHARDQLGNWLRGHRPPEVALRLLEPEGYYRSASFRRLVRDMKSYRRNYLPESDLRRTLRENPWVLPAWENEIVTLIDGMPREGDEEEPEFRLLSDPHVTWNDGPEVWCRVCALPDRLTAPRYLLRCGGEDIALYYRRRSGVIEADRREAQIPLDGHEAVVTLETPDGEAVEVQTIRLWDPELITQVRPVGRETEEAVERLLPGEQVLITSIEAVVTPGPSAWRVVGPRERRRRWWLLDGMERVRVQDGGVVWNGEPPPPPPAWASSVSVSLEGGGGFFQLGQRVRFRIHAAPGVEVAHAACAGQPLSFADAARARTAPVPVRAEMSGRCRLRVGVTHGGDHAVVQREVNLRVRAVTWADDGGEIPRDKPLSCYEALSRPVRLLSDGPTVLVEGREIIGLLPVGRAARIRRVLGTGKELVVADWPFNTRDRFRLARSAVDTGLARSLERAGEAFRLRLFRALLPGERRRLFLWSPMHGMAFLSASEISTEDGGRAWTFRAPWETDTLLTAVAYEGRCIATAWDGHERRFFDPEATDGMDVLTRIALVRWCRLPGLQNDPEAPQYPLIGRLAQHPLEVVRVALLDEGLPTAMGLEFEDRQSPRGESFNVIFREAFVLPTQEGNLAALFHGLPNDFNRLMANHPLLGGRALQAVLPPLAAQSVAQTRMLLGAMRLQLLSLTANTGPLAIAQREAELLHRARGTFSEDGEPMDEYGVREGLIRPVMCHLFQAASMSNGDYDNLRTALGVASFREYLAAMILRHLLEELA